MYGLVFTLVSGNTIIIPVSQLETTINDVLEMTKKAGWVVYDNGTRAVNMDHVVTISEVGGGPEPAQFIPMNRR